MIKSLLGKSPEIHPSAFIAENATIIGDVTIGKDSSIWYSVVIRGDVNFIRIGNRTNIQDGTVIHAAYKTIPTIIGDNVTVGHNAIIHACELKNEAFVGMGATIMDGAVVETHTLVAAGALVPPNSKLERGFLYAGVPAKKIRKLTSEEIENIILQTAEKYILFKSWYK